MDHDQITAALEAKGLSWRAAASATGRSPTTLTRVSKRDMTSKPTALVICALIDRPVEEVFDDKPEYAEPSAKDQKEAAIAEAKKRIKAAGIRKVA